MDIRDRVRELRRVPARMLRPNPRNWRTHPAQQRDALRGVLAEIGFAGALLARELPDGSLELIDGHLRAETAPDQPLPVLVLDVDEREATKLLATHDPLAAMAEADAEQLADLLTQFETNSPAVRQMLDELQQQVVTAEAHTALAADETDRLLESFQVLVRCDDELAQRELIERLAAEGFKCRALFS